MTTTVFVALQHLSCYKCGVIFGVERERYGVLLETHDDFWCPNGHSQRFTSQTDKEKRIAELERQSKALITNRDYWANRTREEADAARRLARSVNGYKGVVTRLKRRTVAGRCPCCSAQFKDLKRHMGAKHPDWNPDKAADAIAARSPSSGQNQERTK